MKLRMGRGEIFVLKPLNMKNLPANAGDLGSSPGLGIYPGEGTGYPLQYSCLEISMDRGAWWTTVHEVSKSWKNTTDFHLFISISKENDFRIQK